MRAMSKFSFFFSLFSACALGICLVAAVLNGCYGNWIEFAFMVCCCVVNVFNIWVQYYISEKI